MTENDGWAAVGDFIRTQRHLADLSLRQLSELSKVSNAYLSQVERGVYQPSAHVLKSIAGALRISAESLFERAGLLDPEGDAEPRERPAVEEAICLDPQLTDEQKDSLLRVYRSFVKKS
jgi:transcriptional regulator with XRE-family HTH domain